MTNEFTPSDELLDDVSTVELHPVETEDERVAREAVEAQAEAEAEALAKLEADEAEAKAKAEAEAAEALAKLEAEAKAIEDARLALAESQKEQAFRCWHHIMTSPKVREEVRAHLLLLEPEALMYGKEKIEAELAALAKEKEAAAAAGFSVPVTMAEATGHETPKKRSGHGR